MDKIHLQDLPSSEIFVLLEHNFRKRLINECLKIIKIKNCKGRSAEVLATYLNIKSEKYEIKSKINRRQIHHWIKGYQYISHKRRAKSGDSTIPVYMPLWVLIELSILILPISQYFSMNEIEKNVDSYRNKSGIIVKPLYKEKYKLPICITPTLTSILAHLIADGCAETQPFYSQDNNIGLNNFKEKVYESFGFFESKFQDSYFSIPSFIKFVLSKYYVLNSFKSNEACIPEKIYHMSINHKMAFISAFIIDEGSITDSIKIFSMNLELLGNLKELIISLGILCSGVINYDHCHFIYIINSPQNIQLLIDLIATLHKKEHLCNLSFKQHKLEAIYKYMKLKGYPRSIRYDFSLLEFNIMNILKSNRNNIKDLIEKKELSSKMGFTTTEIHSKLYLDFHFIISHQALRKFLKQLADKRIIKNIYYNNNLFIWANMECNNINCPDSEILDILKNSSKTIEQISNILKIPYDIIEYRIRKVLKTQSKIHKVGYLISKDVWNRPIKTILWKCY